MTYIGLNINISSQRYELSDYITLTTNCCMYESCTSILHIRIHKCCYRRKSYKIGQEICHPLY